MTCQFPKGDFYIKSAASPSTSISSIKNLVVDVKDGTKAIVAQQKSNDEGYQLWYYKNGQIINKFSASCLEAESAYLYLQSLIVDVGSRIHLKSPIQTSNQRWIISNDGHIALQNKPRFVIEVKATNVKDGSYVALADTGSKTYKNIIAQTKVVDSNLNPVWNEVHYLPVKHIGEKFMLEVMDFNTFIKDRPLGNCHLEITDELVREVSSDVYEGQIHYKVKFFPLEPLPKPTSDFFTNIKKKPFDHSTFCVLVTLQAPNGGFPPSVALANLFGHDSHESLSKLYFKLYKSQCREEHILKTNPTDYRSDWGGVYERAEIYISKAVNDLEIEETVVATGRKAVYLNTNRLTRETISITHIKRLLKCQKSTGEYQVNDDLAKSLGYENLNKLRIAFNEYKDKKSKSSKISQVSFQIWMTMLMLYFYRYIAIDQRKEWFPTYEKSYRWIWNYLKGNESLEQECFNIVKSFVKESYDVMDDVLESDCTFECEIAEMIDSIKYPQKWRGIVQKPYGIARIEIICAKNLKQADSWSGSSASDPFVRISNIVTMFYIPVYDVNEKVNLQVLDYNAFFKDTLLGFYILDFKSIIKELPNGSLEGKQLKMDANLTYKGVNRGQLSFIAEFFSLPDLELDLEVISTSSISIRHLYLLMTYQSQYGCFELTDALARLFNYGSKEELATAFSDYVQKDGAVRSLDHQIWGTVFVTSFLKVLLWKKTDAEVEERLYNYSNKFVIQRFKVTQWIDENQQISLGVLVDIRIVRQFISYQHESGCFELTPQLAEALGFSSVDEAKKHIETHFSSYSPRTAQFDANVWSTAILIWFIRYVLVDYRNEWAGIYQKAYDWLCQQVKDQEVRDELLEAARIFVVKRFEVEQDAIEEDESFKDSLEAKDRYHDREVSEIVDEEPHDFMIPSNDVVGIIRICVKSAQDLKKSDSWFTFSDPDPYVRIMNAAGTKIVRTCVSHGTANPKWDEIHFVSVHGSGEKISFEIFDENLFISDKPLGTYVLDTNTLMKNEDHTKPINEWFPLKIGNKPVKGHLNLEVRFIPTAFTEGVDFEFTRESIKLNHIYMLISWRKANGSFEFTDKLARFFNYKSVDELKEALCWKHYNEWKQIISNSDEWIIKEINDINTEDRLYDLCRTFIIERFKIKTFEKEQVEIISPDNDGCVALNEKIADYYGFKSVDEFLQHLQKYFNAELAVDYRQEWITNYEKSSNWLTRQYNGDIALENEIMDCAKKFIVSRYEVDNEAIEADNGFISIIKNRDAVIKVEREREAKKEPVMKKSKEGLKELEEFEKLEESEKSKKVEESRKLKKVEEFNKSMEPKENKEHTVGSYTWVIRNTTTISDRNITDLKVRFESNKEETDRDKEETTSQVLKDIISTKEELKDIVKDQINEALKDPIDKFNKVTEFIENFIKDSAEESTKEALKDIGNI
ncbi:6009_t:CDS:10 [Racocetra fulgida]|uniref:6009_t:CDS:1 n=1 Tax=Racocetra fulgida TaxID=60492 RepID=A0A9N8VPW8_9GLOM|nr:6009_t:CDS:10 [Racocetra fulgida]